MRSLCLWLFHCSLILWFSTNSSDWVNASFVLLLGTTTACATILLQCEWHAILVKLSEANEVIDCRRYPGLENFRIRQLKMASVQDKHHHVKTTVYFAIACGQSALGVAIFNLDTSEMVNRCGFSPTQLSLSHVLLHVVLVVTVWNGPFVTSFQNHNWDGHSQIRHLFTNDHHFHQNFGALQFEARGCSTFLQVC